MVIKLYTKDDKYKLVSQFTVLFRVGEGITFYEDKGNYIIEPHWKFPNTYVVYEYSDFECEKCIRTRFLTNYKEVDIIWKQH